MIGRRTLVALATAALVAAIAFTVATPQALQASATGLAAADPGLGTPAIIPFEPAPLTGNNGPFDPFTGGSNPARFGRG